MCCCHSAAWLELVTSARSLCFSDKEFNVYFKLNERSVSALICRVSCVFHVDSCKLLTCRLHRHKKKRKKKKDARNIVFTENAWVEINGGKASPTVNHNLLLRGRSLNSLLYQTAHLEPLILRWTECFLFFVFFNLYFFFGVGAIIANLFFLRKKM